MTYQEKKDIIKNRAIDYQNSFCEGAAYTWQDLAEIGAYFEKYARRYGLIKEFKNNGIL